MARSTFEGPGLSGDNRFGPFRNVGSVTLTQNGYLNLLNTTPNTAGYAGASTQFVTGNNIPNSVATIYTPSSTVPYTSSAVVTPSVDASTQIYRGFVCYIPAGSDIDIPIIDVAVVPTGGTISGILMHVSNSFTAVGGTPTYGSVSSISATGRQTSHRMCRTNQFLAILCKTRMSLVKLFIMFYAPVIMFNRIYTIL